MTTTSPERTRCPINFDHESPEHAAAWPEQFEEIRSSCPFSWTEKHGGYWVATRYHDIIEIAQNPDAFTSQKSFDPETGEVKGGLSIPPVPSPRGIPDESDSPEWDGFRTFLNRKLSPKAVEERRQQTERFAAALIDRVIESGHFDIVEDLTNPLPAMTTMAMFGLPLEDWREFADPLHKMMYTPKESPDYLKAVNGLVWIKRRVEEEIALRRAAPRDDLLSYLAHGEINGQKLDDVTIWEMAFNVIIGGVDTTTALTSHVLIYLSRNPAVKQLLIDKPDALPIAREEFVRFFSPVHGMARTAAAVTEFRGEEVAVGDRIYLAYSAANRDPEIFDVPDEIIVDRFPNRHIGFGAGKHRCVGSFQARMMFETMVRAVLQRMPDYRVVGNAEGYPSVGTINGLISAPAVFTPGPKVGATID